MITQIYEIQTPYEAQAVIEAGVDNIGSVIISETSLKQPLLKRTIEIVKKSKSKSSLIPLFSNIDSISRVLDYYKPDIIHFCEDLTKCINNNAYFNFLINLQQNIRIKFPEIKITRSIPICMPKITQSISLLDIAIKFEYISDFFLTDTIITNNSKLAPDSQPVNGFVGITGLTCDWDEARILVDSVAIPVILAGGLSADNVFDAILKVKPAGVDSCTQTNACDKDGKPVRFKKDQAKVKRFVKEAKRAEKQINGG